MNKLKQYKLILVIAVLLGAVVTLAAARLEKQLLILLPVLVLGLLGSVLTGKYKEATYYIIRDLSPGSFERLLREGDPVDGSGIPYPKEVMDLLRGYERFRKAASWLPMAALIVGLVVEIITRNG